MPELSFTHGTDGRLVLLVNGKIANEDQANRVKEALNADGELKNLLWLKVSKKSPQGDKWPWPR